MDALTTERDIDLVLVTGAGASHDFGVNGTKLPLMAGWSEDLVKRLRVKHPGYLTATGLTRDMGPEAFEDQLGRYLRAVEAFELVEPLLEPIASFPYQGSQLVAPEQWRDWHRNARFHLEQITGVIHESLYELFAAPAIDPGAVAAAYGTLLGGLGVAPGSRLVYATTNYDAIAESAVAAIGGLPDAGEVLSALSTAERAIRVERLLDGIPRYVPILHLHGRVGWLRRRDRDAYSTAVRAYNMDLGVPIVMLPDLEKNYDADPVISTLWGQFVEALRRAQRVLVLGHSLHDTALMDALRQHVDPPRRIAVTVLPADPENPGDSLDVTTRVEEQLPGVAVVPLRFHPHLERLPDELLRWRDESAALG